jgi:hypothetical protein
MRGCKPTQQTRIRTNAMGQAVCRLPDWTQCANAAVPNRERSQRAASGCFRARDPPLQLLEFGLAAYWRRVSGLGAGSTQYAVNHSISGNSTNTVCGCPSGHDMS